MFSYCHLAIVITLLIPAALTAQTPVVDSHDASKWDEAISNFENLDSVEAPPKNAVLFVGSSSIRKWDLSSAFPEIDTINRGFGGSQMVDSVFHINTLVLKHQPNSVVVYAGDNDLAKGKTPERIFADFAEFVAILRQKLPNTHIHYIAIKPSLKRWNLINGVRFTNQLIKAYCESHDQLHFIDICDSMLNADGTPNSDLFVEDGLHLSKLGYEMWSEKVEESLESEGPREK